MKSKQTSVLLTGVLVKVPGGSQPLRTQACFATTPSQERARLRHAPRKASLARAPWAWGSGAVVYRSFASFAGTALQQSVRLGAERKYLWNVDQDALAVEMGTVDWREGLVDHIINPFPSSKGNRAKADELRRSGRTADRLVAAGDGAWSDCVPFYDGAAAQAWQEKSEKEQAACIRDRINPLAQQHVAWMRSKRLRQVFRCHYDEHEKSDAYTALLARCVMGTQGWEPCATLYSEWLSGRDGLGDANLGLRAMACNDAGVVARAREIPSQDPGFASVDFAALVGAYTALMDTTDSGKGSALTRLMVEFSGPLAGMVEKAFDGTAGVMAVSLMTASAGKALIRKPFTGTYAEFVHYAARRLVAQNLSMSTANAKAFVEAEVQRIGLHTGKLADKTHIQDWPVMGDAAECAYATSTRNLQGALHNVTELEALPQSQWQAVMRGGARLAIVGGILQLVAMTKLLSSLGGTMAHEKSDTGMKALFGFVGLGCAFADISGRILKNVPERTIYSIVMGATDTLELSKFFLKWAGRVSVGLGVAIGLWDIWKGITEYRKGNLSMTKIYVISGVFGVFSALAFIAWPGVGTLLLCIYMGITIYIETHKDNKIKEWLKRCSFGVGKETKYRFIHDELDDLNSIFIG